MLPLMPGAGEAALTSDVEMLPVAAPVAAAPTVTPNLLKNSRRAMFGISATSFNFVMARFPFGIA
jgi:hypothetical protein